MNGTKSLLQSTTVWGALVVILTTGATMIWGITVGADEQKVIIDGVVAVASAGATVVGAIVSIYGRIKATKQIK